jgi:hypothetical protein
MGNQQVFIVVESLCLRERYKGVEEYVSKLKDAYPVQHKKVWMPSYNECNEFWLDVFINSKFLKFVSDAIIGGFIWDFIKFGWKNLGLEHFISETNDLIEKNSGNIRLVAFKFQFDDITIKVHGLHKNFTSIMSSVFNELLKAVPFLQEHHINNIIEIELPLIEDKTKPEEYRYRFDDFNETGKIEDYLSIWKITAEFGCTQYLYFLQDGNVLEHYGIK